MPAVDRVLDKEPVGSLDAYVDRGGGTASSAARRTAPDALIDLVADSGLRGRGGAGFPTGTKWRTVADSRGHDEPTTVVVNAAEGEPGTFKDRALIRRNPYRILEGAVVAALALGTDRIRIGIKATFGPEIDRLTDAIAAMRTEGWLDGLDVDVVLGPSSYLFGEETGLLEVIEGRQPFPRVTPPYRRGLQDDDTRSVVGVELAMVGAAAGAPALVDNVETLANVALIVEHGSDWFRELGTDASPGTIVCTVSGATVRDGVAEFPMGSTLREVLDVVGWGPRRGHEVRVVLSGVANPLIPVELFDTPLTYEAMRDAGTGLGSAGFVVFDDATDPAAVAAGVARFLAVESCGQCEPCKTDGLFIAEELRTALRGGSRPIDLGQLVRRIGTVTNGARCNLALQQAAVAASLLDLFPESVEPRGTTSASLEPVTIAPIADLVGGRALLDARQATKQPDWSYGATDSGAAPAALLGNTPVHIEAPVPARRWSEWHVDLDAEDPLEFVDQAHANVDAMIDEARSAPDGDSDRDRLTAEVLTTVATHIDVTQRVLYPMARRVGDEEGERLADIAEDHGRHLAALLRDGSPADADDRLRAIADEMRTHAEIEDEVLALIREKLDVADRANLAAGISTARATSTVSRLRLTRSRTVEPTTPVPPAPRPDVAPVSGFVDPDAPATSAEPAASDGPVAPTVPRTSPSATPAEAPPEVEEDVPAPAGGAAPRPRHPLPAPTTLLVGVDGSTGAMSGLDWAGRFAERIGAEVVVSNIFEPSQSEVTPDDYDRLLDDARSMLESEWSEPLRDRAVPHRAVQLTGSPDRLLEATDEVGAGLLVVGTRGAGRFPGLHIGSLAHHLAHETPGPLAIVPVAGATAPSDRIVVGVDGSAGSIAAVEWCAGLAATSGVEVTAVFAFDSGADFGLRHDEGELKGVAEAAISEEWIAPLTECGAKVHTRIVEGSRPAPALADAAEAAGAGLLVVGTRPLSEPAGRRLVRVPMQLVHATHLPVVVVPAPPEDER